jgi:hypothetical protein
MLERSRRDRHRNVRESIRDTTRFNGVPTRKVIVVLLTMGALLALLVALNKNTTHGPPLATNCRTPAIALSSPATGDGTDITYSITGPQAGTYLVAVDAATATVHGSGADVTPPKAIAVAIHRGLGSCKAHGTLPSLTEGSHQVELFRDGTVVAKAALR